MSLVLCFIGFEWGNRHTGLPQQAQDQVHRHPDDVVEGSSNRAYQAATFALYSVGTGLILRFTTVDVTPYHGR
jgi:hypothetical protein